MRTEDQNIAAMEQAQERAYRDQFTQMWNNMNRSQRRAYKARLKRLVRAEGRKQSRAK